jgi:hypothetical protein
MPAMFRPYSRHRITVALISMTGTRARGTRRLVLVAIAIVACAAAAPIVSHSTSRDNDANGGAAAFGIPGFRSADAPVIARPMARIPLRLAHRVSGNAFAIDVIGAAVLLLAGAHLRRRRSGIGTSPAVALLFKRRGPPRLHVSG